MIAALNYLGCIFNLAKMRITNVTSVKTDLADNRYLFSSCPFSKFKGKRAVLAGAKTYMLQVESVFTQVEYALHLVNPHNQCLQFILGHEMSQEESKTMPMLFFFFGGGGGKGGGGLKRCIIRFEKVDN